MGQNNPKVKSETKNRGIPIRWIEETYLWYHYLMSATIVILIKAKIRNSFVSGTTPGWILLLMLPGCKQKQIQSNDITTFWSKNYFPQKIYFTVGLMLISNLLHHFFINLPLNLFPFLRFRSCSVHPPFIFNISFTNVPNTFSQQRKFSRWIYFGMAIFSASRKGLS